MKEDLPESLQQIVLPEDDPDLSLVRLSLWFWENPNSEPREEQIEWINNIDRVTLFNFMLHAHQGLDRLKDSLLESKKSG